MMSRFSFTGRPQDSTLQSASFTANLSGCFVPLIDMLSESWDPIPCWYVLFDIVVLACFQIFICDLPGILLNYELWKKQQRFRTSSTVHFHKFDSA